MQPKREIHGLGFRVSPATQMQSVKNRTSWNTKEASSEVKSRYRMGCRLLEGCPGISNSGFKICGSCPVGFVMRLE